MTFTYHRLANPLTQSLTVAKLQTKSGEIWGYEHRGGDFPSVKAYRGVLPDKAGIQFETGISPNKFTPNNLAIWRLPRHGGADEVEEREQAGSVAACIKVDVALSRYGCGKRGS